MDYVERILHIMCSITCIILWNETIYVDTVVIIITILLSIWKLNTSYKGSVHNGRIVRNST